MHNNSYEVEKCSLVYGEVLAGAYFRAYKRFIRINTLTL